MREVDRAAARGGRCRTRRRREHHDAHRRLVGRARHDPGRRAHRHRSLVARMRVGPGFFATLGTPLVAGRDFDRARDPSGRRAAGADAPSSSTRASRGATSRTAVRSAPAWDSGNRPDTATDVEIIGVVKDFSRRNLRDQEVEQAFLPFWMRDSDDGTFYVRVRGGAEAAFARDSRRGRAGGPGAAGDAAHLRRPDPAVAAHRADAGDAVERLRRARAAAVGRRPLRRDVVRGRAAHAGDRRAAGARRDPRPSAVWLVVRDAADHDRRRHRSSRSRHVGLCSGSSKRSSSASVRSMRRPSSSPAAC